MTESVTDDATDDVHLRATDEHRRVDVHVTPGLGGRIRQITIAVPDSAPGGSVDLLTSTDDPDPDSLAWGSFPMAPWVGRIRHGRFRFLGNDVRLDLDHVDGGDGAGGGSLRPPVAAPDHIDPADRRHAIHGTTFFRPWTVVAHDPGEGDMATIEMTCRIDGERSWPFGGLARQRITVSARRIDLELAVETDGDPFPASVGWHPWFVKPDRLEFSPAAMYERDEIGSTTAELVAPAPPPWDDCFAHCGPVVLHYDRPVAPTVTVDSDCDHLVVFSEPTHATCVEPQSGPPDGPNLRPEISTSDHPVRRTMTISW